MKRGRPLYEGVDWNNGGFVRRCKAIVALFTRAWIEIPKLQAKKFVFASPSLRGRGLKWFYNPNHQPTFLSPSLRGRGLKSFGTAHNSDDKRSPSLRGRGLKFFRWFSFYTLICRPLYEGVDWNGWNNQMLTSITGVALFTRAWIEMLLSKPI